MNGLIVMQGETYEEERKQSLLQTAIFDRSGARNFSWEYMNDLVPGDLVMHYVKGQIKALSVVKEPTHIVTDEAGQKKYRAKVAYTDLERPLDIAPLFENIRPLLPEKYAPFQQDGSGNSGYLFPIHVELTLYLIKQLRIVVEDQLIQPTLLEETSNLTVSLLGKLRDWQTAFIAQRDEFLQQRRLDALTEHTNCAICGAAFAPLLDVPFIKAPEKCTQEERLDKYNALVLCHNHHMLFKEGLVTMNDKGQLLVSERLVDEQYALGLYEGQQVMLVKEQKKYVKWHRNQVFQSI